MRARVRACVRACVCVHVRMRVCALACMCMCSYLCVCACLHPSVFRLSFLIPMTMFVVVSVYLTLKCE